MFLLTCWLDELDSHCSQLHLSGCRPSDMSGARLCHRQSSTPDVFKYWPVCVCVCLLFFAGDVTTFNTHIVTYCTYMETVHVACVLLYVRFQSVHTDVGFGRLFRLLVGFPAASDWDVLTSADLFRLIKPSASNLPVVVSSLSELTTQWLLFHKKHHDKLPMWSISMNTSAPPHLLPWLPHYLHCSFRVPRHIMTVIKLFFKQSLKSLPLYFHFLFWP